MNLHCIAILLGNPAFLHRCPISIHACHIGESLFDVTVFIQLSEQSKSDEYRTVVVLHLQMGEIPRHCR